MVQRFRRLALTATLAALCAGPVLAEQDAPDALPAGMKGFRGILVGKLVSKDQSKETFVLEVERVRKVWKQSEADDPSSAVGKSLTIDIHGGRLAEQHRKTLRGLQPGDPVDVEAFHFEKDHLSVMELLRKVE